MKKRVRSISDMVAWDAPIKFTEEERRRKEAWERQGKDWYSAEMMSPNGKSKYAKKKKK
jgi:hypothetical protein